MAYQWAPDYSSALNLAAYPNARYYTGQEPFNTYSDPNLVLNGPGWYDFRPEDGNLIAQSQLQGLNNYFALRDAGLWNLGDPNSDTWKFLAANELGGNVGDPRTDPNALFRALLGTGIGQAAWSATDAGANQVSGAAAEALSGLNPDFVRQFAPAIGQVMQGYYGTLDRSGSPMQGINDIPEATRDIVMDTPIGAAIAAYTGGALMGSGGGVTAGAGDMFGSAADFGLSAGDMAAMGGAAGGSLGTIANAGPTGFIPGITDAGNAGLTLGTSAPSSLADLAASGQTGATIPGIDTIPMPAAIPEPDPTFGDLLTQTGAGQFEQLPAFAGGTLAPSTLADLAQMPLPQAGDLLPASQLPPPAIDLTAAQGAPFQPPVTPPIEPIAPPAPISAPPIEAPMAMPPQAPASLADLTATAPQTLPQTLAPTAADLTQAPATLSDLASGGGTAPPIITPDPLAGLTPTDLGLEAQPFTTNPSLADLEAGGGGTSIAGNTAMPPPAIPEPDPTFGNTLTQTGPGTFETMPSTLGGAGAPTPIGAGTVAGGAGAAAGNASGGPSSGGTNNAASGTPLSRLLDGTAQPADYASILGTIGATGLGAYAANQQTQAYKDLANQYMAMGAPYRDRLAALYANPSSYLSSSEVQVPVQQGTDALARALSIKGNPAGSGTALQELQNYSANQLYGRLGEEKNRLAGYGGLTAYNAAAPQAASQAVGSSGGIYNALGYGLGQLTNPQPSLAQQLNQYRGLLGSLT